MVKVLFVMLLFLGGCATPKPQEQVVLKYPKWYTPLHMDNSLYYYGIGEGVSQKEAIAVALNDIASKLSITIESVYTTDTNIHTTNGEENYTQTINNQIKNEVAKIEFSSYEVINYEKLNDATHIVKVAIDRVKNAKLKKQKIEEKIKSYQKTLTSKDTNTISKLKNLNEISDEINNETLRECYVVKTLNYDKEIDANIKTLSDIESKIKAFKNSVTFGIYGDIRYKNIVLDKVSTKGYNIVQNYPKVKISIDTDETQLYVMGNHIYKAKVYITVLIGNKTVGKKTLTVGAKSRTSYEQAREFGLVEFRSRLEMKKVFEELVGI